MNISQISSGLGLNRYLLASKAVFAALVSLIATTPFSSVYAQLSITSDGRIIATEMHGVVRLLDLKSGRELGQIKPPNFGKGVAISPDGTTVVMGNTHGGFSMWSIPSQSERTVPWERNGSAMNPEEYVFSPDGTMIAAIAADCVKVWDVAAGTSLMTFCYRNSPPVYSVAFSRNSKAFVVAAGYWADIYSVAEKKDLGRIDNADRDKLLLLHAIYGIDGKTLITAQPTGIAQWDLSTAERIREMKGHTDWVTSLALAPSGTILASGGSDKDSTVRLWDLATGKERKILKHRQGASIRSVAFTPDGRAVISQTYDNEIQVWDTASGTLVRRLVEPEEKKGGKKGLIVQ